MTEIHGVEDWNIFDPFDESTHPPRDLEATDCSENVWVWIDARTDKGDFMWCDKREKWIARTGGFEIEHDTTKYLCYWRKI